MWHAQITSLTLRQVSSSGAFDRHEAYTAVAQVELLGAATAHIHAVLRVDGHPLGRADLRELATMLRDEYGVASATVDRHGQRKTLNADRWAAVSSLGDL